MDGPRGGGGSGTPLRPQSPGAAAPAALADRDRCLFFCCVCFYFASPPNNIRLKGKDDGTTAAVEREEEEEEDRVVSEKRKRFVNGGGLLVNTAANVALQAAVETAGIRDKKRLAQLRGMLERQDRQEEVAGLF